MEIVKTLEGARDGVYDRDALECAAQYIENEFKKLGFHIDYDEFDFQGKVYRNLIATSSGIDAEREWYAVCAHYDTVAGSPGADDNASGVAVMLETARALGPQKGLQFIAFTLEEPQMTGATFLYGSRNFVKVMKGRGHSYKGLYNLESVGYVSSEPGSQQVPPLLNAPHIGDFIALVGNSGSEKLMSLYEDIALNKVPDLKVFTHKVMMNGYLLLPSRFSDHAPFWDAGFPAVMITDTAMMRNPNYHTRYDTSDSISPEFMEQVAKALIFTLEEMLYLKE
ncbi:MAG: M28 family peptidase [Deltaproteobacteria bacterium]|nr:M28 family peptidase [Deltaproteobacteria bacterium]